MSVCAFDTIASMNRSQLLIISMSKPHWGGRSPTFMVILGHDALGAAVCDPPLIIFCACDSFGAVILLHLHSVHNAL